MSTNVVKKHTKVAVPESLTQEERQKLKNVTTGYRCMKMAEEGAKVNRTIIYKAIAGMTITPRKAASIRLYLAGQLVTEETINAFLARHSQPAEK